MDDEDIIRNNAYDFVLIKKVATLIWLRSPVIKNRVVFLKANS